MTEEKKNLSVVLYTSAWASDICAKAQGYYESITTDLGVPLVVKDITLPENVQEAQDKAIVGVPAAILFKDDVEQSRKVGLPANSEKIRAWLEA